MTGLTPFLCAMVKTPADRLATANPDRLAAKYEIRPDWARFYLNAWRNR